MIDPNEDLPRLFIETHDMLEDVVLAGKIQAAHGFALFGFFKVLRTDWDKGILDCIQSSDFQLGLNRVVANSLAVASACKRLRALMKQYEEQGETLLKFLYDLPGVFYRLYDSEVELLQLPAYANNLEYCEFVRVQVHDNVLHPCEAHGEVKRRFRKYMSFVDPEFDYRESISNPFYRS